MLQVSASTPPALVRVVGFEANTRKGCTEYAVELGTRGIVVKRRFSEFLQLREDLLSVFEDAPSLPSRIFRTKPEERLPLLNAFLQSICETLAAQPPKPLLRFLNVDMAVFAGAREAAYPHTAAKVEVEVGTPKVPERFRGEIERVVQEVLETAKARDGHDGWRLVGNQAPFTWMARAEDAKLGVKPNRVAFGELKRCPPRLVHELMLDNDACKQMEPKLDSIQDVAKIDEHTFVQHFVMKSIMFMPPRDVILVRHWRVLPDQRIIHAEFSLEDFPGVPSAESANRVRAKLTVGGVVLQPVEGDPTSCKVWRVNDMDPRLGDAIPAYALAKLNEFTAAMLSNNMFSLAKLVAKSDIQTVLGRGPLVNWNGAVKGPIQPVLNQGEEQIETQKKDWIIKQEMVLPVTVSFIIGFATASVGFLISTGAGI